MTKQAQSLAQMLENFPAPIKTLPTGVDPTLGFQALVSAWQSYKQVCAQEETRREQIRAQKEVAIERIRTQAELLRQLLSETFAERQQNFERMFSLLDAGIQTGNDRQIDAAVTMILAQVKESPLRQAVEAVQLLRERKPGEIIDL